MRTNAKHRSGLSKGRRIDHRSGNKRRLRTTTSGPLRSSAAAFNACKGTSTIGPSGSTPATPSLAGPSGGCTAAVTPPITPPAPVVAKFKDELGATVSPDRSSASAGVSVRTKQGSVHSPFSHGQATSASTCESMQDTTTAATTAATAATATAATATAATTTTTTTTSAGQTTAVGEFSSLWDFLREELTANEEHTAAEMKRERVTNFIHVPSAIEKIRFSTYLLFFRCELPLHSTLYSAGYLAGIGGSCSVHRSSLPSLLYVCDLAVFIPTDCPYTFDRYLKLSQRIDLVKALVIGICCIGLQMIDAARLYHGVRDILDSLIFKIGVSDGKRTEGDRMQHLHPVTHFILAVVYLFLHSMILFYQLVTLNVAINSYHNALLTLLISNQFVEIKSSVFKRFEKENLFQLSCADIVERFQLSIFLIVIAIRNFTELSGSASSSSLPTAFFLPLPANTIMLYNVFTPVVLVFGCEMLVDWLKHAFITKFNHIRPSVYERFMEVLSRDLVAGPGADTTRNSSKTRRVSGHNVKQILSGHASPFARTRWRVFIDHSPVVARRLGFAAFPLVCVTFRNGIQITRILSLWDAPEMRDDTSAIFQKMVFSDGDWTTRCLVAVIWILLAVAIYTCLVFLKLLIGINLFRFASARCEDMQKRENAKEESQHAAAESKRFDRDYQNQVKRDLRGDQDNVADGQRSSVTLDTIDRYTLFKSRIP